MKTLTGISDTICGFDGKPLAVAVEGDDGTPERINWTIGDALLAVVTMSTAKGKDRFELFDAAEKVRDAPNGSVELENHEFELLKQETEKCERYTNAILVPVLRRFKAAQKAAGDTED